MNWLRKRLSEPSTYAGLGAVILGFGQVGKIGEAAAVADAVAGAGQAVAAGLPWWQALAVAALGAVSMMAGEKGRS